MTARTMMLPPHARTCMRCCHIHSSAVQGHVVEAKCFALGSLAIKCAACTQSETGRSSPRTCATGGDSETSMLPSGLLATKPRHAAIPHNRVPSKRLTREAIRASTRLGTCNHACCAAIWQGVYEILQIETPWRQLVIVQHYSGTQPTLRCVPVPDRSSNIPPYSFDSS